MPRQKQNRYSLPVRILAFILAFLVASGLLSTLIWMILSFIN